MLLERYLVIWTLKLLEKLSCKEYAMTHDVKNHGTSSEFFFLPERVPCYNAKTVEEHKEKQLFWKSKSWNPFVFCADTSCGIS
jgi:hypothetical protein